MKIRKCLINRKRFKYFFNYIFPFFLLFFSHFKLLLNNYVKLFSILISYFVIIAII